MFDESAQTNGLFGWVREWLLQKTYVKLKLGKMLVKVFTALRPKVKGEKREGLPKKYLKVWLLYKQKDAIHQALNLLRKEP